jgi:hypothetical protein
MKLHFDGHGLNDEQGTRIAKVQIEQWDNSGGKRNPEFDRISIDLAHRYNNYPALYEALKELHFRFSHMDDPADVEILDIAAAALAGAESQGDDDEVAERNTVTCHFCGNEFPDSETASLQEGGSSCFPCLEVNADCGIECISCGSPILPEQADTAMGEGNPMCPRCANKFDS